MSIDLEYVEQLERANESLLRKLRGVRRARKRDAENAEEQLDWYIDIMGQQIQRRAPKKLSAFADELFYKWCAMREQLIEDGKITRSDWVDAEEKVERQHGKMDGGKKR